MSTETEGYVGYTVRPRGRDPRGTGWSPCRRTGSANCAGGSGSRQPFRGVTTDGQVVPGLVPLQATGIAPADLQCSEGVQNLLDRNSAPRSPSPDRVAELAQVGQLGAVRAAARRVPRDR